MSVLISRMAANGDVLVASAVIPALKEKHPGHPIYFATNCPHTLMHNPYIDYLVSSDAVNEKFEYKYDLNDAYEKRPNCNMLQAYADVADVDVNKCKMYICCERVDKPLLNKYVVIHAGNTEWVGRNWSKEGWKEVALKLHDTGYQIVCVGQGKDYFVPCDVDVRNATTVGQLATIIKDAKMFVGIDSLPMHIAQAVNTPGVAFFGSIDPKTRIINENMQAITANNLACLGCHHRKPVPSYVTNTCETGLFECERNITVNDISDKIHSILSSF